MGEKEDEKKVVDDDEEEEEEAKEDTSKYWTVDAGKKRERAKTQHTVVEAPKESTKKSRVGEKGKGTELGDMARVNDMLGKNEGKSREIQLLHKVLFGEVGKATMRKKQIRTFSGLTGVTTE